MSKAILTDITKCIGCLECVSACKIENKLAMDQPKNWQKNDGLSAKNWTSILEKPDKHYIRKQCRHCLEPPCKDEADSYVTGLYASLPHRCDYIRRA